MSAYYTYVEWHEELGIVDGNLHQVVQLSGASSKKLRRMMGKALVQEWNNQVRGLRYAKGIKP